MRVGIPPARHSHALISGLHRDIETKINKYDLRRGEKASNRFAARWGITRLLASFAEIASFHRAHIFTFVSLFREEIVIYYFF